MILTLETELNAHVSEARLYSLSHALTHLAFVNDREICVHPVRTKGQASKIPHKSPPVYAEADGTEEPLPAHPVPIAAHWVTLLDQDTQQSERIPCLVTGYASGHIRIHLPSGGLLATAWLHAGEVRLIGSRGSAAAPASGLFDRSEDLHILYSDGTVCRIEGESLQSHLHARHAAIWNGDNIADEMQLMNMTHKALVCKKWRLAGQDALEGAVIAGLSRAPLFDLASFQTSTYDILGVGKYPVLAKYHAEEDTTQFNAGELAKKVASTVVSFAKSWWTGSKDTSTAVDPELRPDKTSSRVVYPHGSLSDDQRHAMSATLSPDDVLAAVTDGYGRVMLVDVSRLTIVRMFKGYREAQCAWLTDPFQPSGWLLAIYAPRRGIVELWRCRHGPRVAAANVGENCLLLGVGTAHIGGKDGSGGDHHLGDEGTSRTLDRVAVECAILRPTGVLESITAPMDRCGSDDDVSMVAEDESMHVTASDADTEWLGEVENAIAACVNTKKCKDVKKLLTDGVKEVSAATFYSAMQLVLNIDHAEIARDVTESVAENTSEPTFWLARCHAITAWQSAHEIAVREDPESARAAVDLPTFVRVFEEGTPAPDSKQSSEAVEALTAVASLMFHVLLTDDEGATVAQSAMSHLFVNDLTSDHAEALFLSYFFHEPLRTFFRHVPADSLVTKWLAAFAQRQLESAQAANDSAIEPVLDNGEGTGEDGTQTIVPEQVRVFRNIFRYCQETENVPHALGLVPFCLAAVARKVTSSTKDDDGSGDDADKGGADEDVDHDEATGELIDGDAVPQWELLQRHLEGILAIVDRLRSLGVEPSGLTVSSMASGEYSFSEQIASSEISLGFTAIEMTRYANDARTRLKEAADADSGDTNPDAALQAAAEAQEDDEDAQLGDLVAKFGSHLSDMSVSVHRTNILFSRLLQASGASGGLVSGVESLGLIPSGVMKRALVGHVVKAHIAGPLYRLATLVDSSGKFPSERSCVQHFSVSLSTMKQFLIASLACIDSLRENQADEGGNILEGQYENEQAASDAVIYPWFPLATADRLVKSLQESPIDVQLVGAISALIRLLTAMVSNKEFAGFRLRSIKLLASFPSELDLLRGMSDKSRATTKPDTAGSDARPAEESTADDDVSSDPFAARLALLTLVLSRDPPVAFGLANELSFPSRTMDRLRCEHVRILYERQQDPLGEEALLGIANSDLVGNMLLTTARARLCVILKALHGNKKSQGALAIIPADTAEWIHGAADVPNVKLPRAPSLAATKSLLSRIVGLLEPGSSAHHRANSLLQTATSLLRELT